MTHILHLVYVNWMLWLNWHPLNINQPIYLYVDIFFDWGIIIYGKDLMSRQQQPKLKIWNVFTDIHYESFKVVIDFIFSVLQIYILEIHYI